MSLPLEAPLAALLEEAVHDGVAPEMASAILWRNEWIHACACSADGARPIEVSAGGGDASGATWFDLASLTKPLVTGLCALRLVERGELALEAPVARYLPTFGAGKAEVQLQDLLDHTSGLPAWRPFFRRVIEDAEAGAIFRGLGNAPAFLRGRQLIAEAVDAEPLASARRGATVYSDLGFLALGRVVTAVAGPLDVCLRREVLDRLGVGDAALFDLAAAPAPTDRPLAATGRTRPREPAPGQEGDLAGLPLAPVGLRPGEVDDDNAFACGGVAGHAGLFGTVTAVARLARAFLDDVHGAGRLAGRELALRFATPRPGSTRGLAWDRPEPGGSLGTRLGRGQLGAVGHLGFTGGSVWIDLDAKLVVALCSNRTLLGRANHKIRAFRPRFHDAVAELLKLG